MSFHSLTTRLAYFRALAAAAIAACALIALQFCLPPPARAVPSFSLQYNTPCSTCHTVVPHLNKFGQAFQANLFRSKSLTIDPSPKWAGVPFSVIATASGFRDSTNHITAKPEFHTVEVFAAGSYALDRNRSGGYFVDDVAWNRDSKGGDLEDAWASVPVAGKRGQFALTVGQWTPMMYQYDPVNSLTQTLPTGIAAGVDAFSFTGPTPGIRLDFFDNRGNDSADGNYISAGLPYSGHLSLNNDSRFYNPRGAFVHAFRRMGDSSLGGFGYLHDSNTDIGILGTRWLSPNLSVIGVGSLGHDRFGSYRNASAEADYTPLSRLGVAGRLDSTSGGGLESEIFPVASVTYVPMHPEVLRLSAETVQRKHSKTYAIYAFVQF